MKYFYLIGILFSLVFCSNDLNAQGSTKVVKSDDSLTLAQAHINLKLTKIYFDSISLERVSKIIPFEEKELATLHDTSFINSDRTLYNFTYSLLYFNKAKLLFKTKKEINRTALLGWFDTLNSAIDNFNNAKIIEIYTFNKRSYTFDSDVKPIWEKDAFYELVKFDFEDCWWLQGDIMNLKNEFTPYFNEDIYPDFQSIFYKAKNSNEFDFDSLFHYAGIYGMSINKSILENKSNEPEYHPSYYDFELSIGKKYGITQKLDLISRYLQLNYFASAKNVKLPANFNLYNLYDSYRIFKEYLDYSNLSNEDAFFKKELNAEVCSTLYEKLQKKYPFNYKYETLDKNGNGDVDGVTDYLDKDEKSRYFFPEKVPLASATKEKKNYKPELKVFSAVDNYLSAILYKAGYKNRLHYYYHDYGFAMATSLEKFNMDGEPLANNQRWDASFGNDRKFSYFEVFKNMFLDTESEFRMFVFLVTSKDVSMSNESMSPSRAQDLMKYSYTALPDDLKNKTLPNKNLTVLVYHFNTNDVGEAPQLNRSNKITLEKYLQIAGLSAILK